MSYKIVFTKTFLKDAKILDRYTRELVHAWIRKNLNGIENPRSIGKALKGSMKGFWRYRIGDYRLICMIEDDQLLILALNVGHRKEIYK